MNIKIKASKQYRTYAISWHKHSSYRDSKLFENALAQNEFLLSDKYPICPRFCLSYPQVVSAIPGILNEKEVKENIIASNLGPLEADQIREFQKAYQKIRFLIEDNTLKSVQYHG